MILGALAIADEERELAGEILVSALKSIPHGVSVYEPSGAYPEGPSYWQYGTSYTCLTIKGLTTALGTDFDLHQAPGLDKTGWFRIHTIGPTGSYFNYADCGVELASGLRHVLARGRLRSADALHGGTANVWRSRFQPTSVWNRAAWIVSFRWKLPGTMRAANGRPSPNCHWTQASRVSRTWSRCEVHWGDANAIYVGFKGGDNQTNHGHLDIGSFVLDAQGVRWALDLGADNYNLPGFFGGRRWQYYRLINHSHNTIVINDQIQNPNAKCPVISFHSTPSRCGAIVDMTNAYKDQVESAWRGIEMLERRAIHVRDEISRCQAATSGGRMVTTCRDRVGRQQSNTSSGRQNTAGGDSRSRRMPRFEILPNKPPTKQEKQNEGTHILAIRHTADPQAKSRDQCLAATDRERNNKVTMTTYLTHASSEHSVDASGHNYFAI